MIRVYKAKLADALRASGLYDLVPADAWNANFVVDIKPVARCPDCDGELRVVRVSFKPLAVLPEHVVAYLDSG